MTDELSVGYLRLYPLVAVVCERGSQNSGKNVYWFIMEDIMKNRDEMPCPLGEAFF